jgi:hypothetical protein
VAFSYSGWPGPKPVRLLARARKLWRLLADASDSKTRIGDNLAAFEEMERVALGKFAKVNPSSNVALPYLNAARDARKEIKRFQQEAGLMIKVAEELKISGIPMNIPVVRQALYGALKLINCRVRLSPIFQRTRTNLPNYLAFRNARISPIGSACSQTHCLSHLRTLAYWLESGGVA